MEETITSVPPNVGLYSVVPHTAAYPTVKYGLKWMFVFWHTILCVFHTELCKANRPTVGVSVMQQLL